MRPGPETSGELTAGHADRARATDVWQLPPRRGWPCRVDRSTRSRRLVGPRVLSARYGRLCSTKPVRQRLRSALRERQHVTRNHCTGCFDFRLKAEATAELLNSDC